MYPIGMIKIVTSYPDGTPQSAECEDCGQRWDYTGGREWAYPEFLAFVRIHLRNRVLPPLSRHP